MNCLGHPMYNKKCKDEIERRGKMENVNRIFDAFGAMSKIVHRQDMIDKKKVEIQSLENKTCGHCYYWMKSTCKPEKIHKQFKSSSAIACKDFEIEPWVKSLLEKRKDELKALEGKDG